MAFVNETKTAANVLMHHISNQVETAPGQEIRAGLFLKAGYLIK